MTKISNPDFCSPAPKNDSFQVFQGRETLVPLRVPLQSFKMSLIYAGVYYYGMSKQQYRSEMGIMGDILNVTMEGGRQGTIVSAISRKANLSHYAVIDKCEKLSTAGLVQTIKTDKNRLYAITEKGIEFVQEFRKFQSILDALNLRY